MKTVVVNWAKEGIVINDFFVEEKIVERAGYELVNSDWLWDELFELYGRAYQTLPETKNYCTQLKRNIAYLADVDDEPVFYLNLKLLLEKKLMLLDMFANLF
ncbi:hypothetical protein ACOILU_001058 [Campylobacter jejuni]|uniref:hypothetical protein n=1 Tax=Campylobacter jejuni TaxID=197 RepID=UPI002044A370|nr:hypothetical protein [Campylobacter jejuni]MDN2792495.1 hypothetical protein [Campylobacter jejuni]BDL69848.1 hypothetical protein THJ014_13080 [Campylobacter jejuni]